MLYRVRQKVHQSRGVSLVNLQGQATEEKVIYISHKLKRISQMPVPGQLDFGLS